MERHRERETGEEETDLASAGRASGAHVLAAGADVDHFRILRWLGQGGMGQVYAARDTKLGRKVALKVIQPALLGSKSAVERFLFEARATARFAHPNIVTVHAVGEHEGLPYLALEYLEGADLQQRIAERPPGPQEAARIGLAIADALAEAHRHGILHRDLKPQNVVIPGDGRPRVVDFGLAKRMGGREAVDPLDDADGSDVLESAGGIQGTPAYMAPEQWRGDELTAAADAWALGVILFELGAGRRPFDEETIAGISIAVCSPKPAPRLDAFADVDPRLAEIVARCLEKDAARRPAADEIAVVLGRLLRADAAPGESVESPFRGLLPFDERHAALFFGRESECGEIVERARSRPVLPVVGASGAGKSSFVHAGVVPRLREQGRWVVLRLRPGAKPFEALASRLLRYDSTLGLDPTIDGSAPQPPGEPDRKGRSGVDVDAVVTLARRLWESPEWLAVELRKITADHGGRALLLIDQMEEIVSLVDDPETQRRFIDAVCGAADDPDDPVRVVFTVRDDFVGRLAVSARAREALRDLTVLQMLEAPVLERILRAPIEAVGYRFEDERLASEMVAEVAGLPTALPHLQFAAQVLWERRDSDRKLVLRSSYAAMGGVAGALARHADGVVEGFSHEQRAIARALLLRLVTAARTRRPLLKSAALEGMHRDAESVLARLIDARLVSVAKAVGSETALELAHESLIVTWTRLARWVDESREEIAFLAEVGQAAEIWGKRGHHASELWQGEGLADALRMMERAQSQIPDLVRRFLEEGRRLEGQRRARRRTAIAGIMAALAVVAVVLGLQKREADAQRDRAERQQSLTEQQRAASLREGARGARAQGDPLQARAKVRLALEVEDALSARALVWQLENEPLVWSRSLGALVYDVELSPDGEQVAAACQDGAVYLFDRKSGAVSILRGHGDQVIGLAYSPDGRLLASGDHAGEIRLWDLRLRGSPRVLHGHEARLRELELSRDGRYLVSSSDDRTARIWDVASGEQRVTLRGHDAGVTAATFSPDQTLVATASGKRARIWDAGTGKLLRDDIVHDAEVNDVAFSADGKLVASGGAEEVRVSETATGRRAWARTGKAVNVFRLVFHPDGRRLITTGVGTVIEILSADDGRELGRIAGHTSTIHGLGVSSDGRWIATGSFDRSVRLWDLTVPAATRDIAPHTQGVGGLSFTPDGRQLASGGWDNALRIWDVATGERVRALEGHQSPAINVRFDPPGKRLATGSDDGFIRIWDTETWKPLHVFRGHEHIIGGLSFGPDGRELASASWDRMVRLWDPASGRELRAWTAHDGRVHSVSISPDGSRVATASSDVRVFRMPNGELEQTFDVAAVSAAFDRSSRRIASANFDGRIHVHDVESGASRELGRVAGRVIEIAFHPGGEALGVAVSDGTAQVWTIADRSIRVLRGHHGEVNAIEFSRDGTIAATGGDDHTVRLWNVATGRPIWRAPVLLADPPLLLSHLGWKNLATGEQQAPRESASRTRLERAARLALPLGDGSLCIWTDDDAIELWSVAASEPRAMARVDGALFLAAAPGVCVAASRDRVVLVGDEGGRTLLENAKVDAIAAARTEIAVVSEGALATFDSRGERRPDPRLDVGAGVAALLRLDPSGDHVVGYRDGALEVWSGGARPAKRPIWFEGAPSSPPVAMEAGPPGTLLVGYSNGVLGLWDLLDGTLLGQTRLHGPVSHLLFDGHVLHAVTTLGGHVRWDLHAFFRDHCDLVRELWERVPIVWEDGRAIIRAAPTDHRCRAQ